MTDSELIEHMHARGWRTEAIDVPMIREACKALQASASAEPVQPPYPEGVVFGPCVCGSWPGGECLKCQWIASPVTAAREQEASATGAEPTEAMLKHFAAIDNSLSTADMRAIIEGVLALATPTTSTTGKVYASRVRDEALSAFDKAVAEELPRVSTIPYNSHEICKWFAENVRKLLAGTPKSAEGEGA